MAAVGSFLVGCGWFDPGRRALRWQAKTDSSYLGTPAVGPDGTIYVGGADGIFTFDSTGTPGPKFLEGQSCQKLVVASNTRLYVLQYDSLVRLIALDPVSGEQAWQCIADTGQPLAFGYLAAALAADGTVYVPACSSLVAVNPDGTVRWRFRTGMEFYNPPVIGPDGTVYAPVVSWVIAIDSSGSERWRHQVPSLEHGPLAVGQDGTVYSGCFRGGVVVAINPDGTERWRSAAPVPNGCPFVIDEDGALYYSNNSETLYCLNSDGTFRWRHYMRPAPDGSCAIGPDGTIYFTGETGGWWTPTENYVLAYSPDGKRLWDYATGGRAYGCPCLGPANTVIFSLQPGDLWAFAAPGTGRNNAWPMYQHDPAHTGRAGQ